MTLIVTYRSPPSMVVVVVDYAPALTFSRQACSSGSPLFCLSILDSGDVAGSSANWLDNDIE